MLAKANTSQKKLIPKREPEVEGFEIASKCIWCDEIGGDYYDFIEYWYQLTV